MAWIERDQRTLKMAREPSSPPSTSSCSPSPSTSPSSCVALAGIGCAREGVVVIGRRAQSDVGVEVGVGARLGQRVPTHIRHNIAWHPLTMAVAAWFGSNTSSLRFKKGAVAAAAAALPSLLPRSEAEAEAPAEVLGLGAASPGSGFPAPGGPAAAAAAMACPPVSCRLPVSWGWWCW